VGGGLNKFETLWCTYTQKKATHIIVKTIHSSFRSESKILSSFQKHRENKKQVKEKRVFSTKSVLVPSLTVDT